MLWCFEPIALWEVMKIPERSLLKYGMLRLGVTVSQSSPDPSFPARSSSEVFKKGRVRESWASRLSRFDHAIKLHRLRNVAIFQWHLPLPFGWDTVCVWCSSWQRVSVKFFDCRPSAGIVAQPVSVNRGRYGRKVASLEAHPHCLAASERPSLMVFHWSQQCLLHATSWPHWFPSHIEQYRRTYHWIFHRSIGWSYIWQPHLTFWSATTSDPCRSNLRVHCGNLVFNFGTFHAWREGSILCCTDVLGVGCDH